jgi:hypothetical protein
MDPEQLVQSANPVIVIDTGSLGAAAANGRVKHLSEPRKRSDSLFSRLLEDIGQFQGE